MNSIRNDQDAIKIIDELKYALKERNDNSKIANKLNDVLNDIINIFLLDQDQHSFASIPITLPAKITRLSSLQDQTYKDFVKSVYNWLPNYSIKISKFVERCLFNADDKITASDIRSAILDLKENDKIKIDLKGYITKK